MIELELGNKENIRAALEAKEIEVIDITSEEQSLKDGSKKPIISLLCKHPDAEKLIELRKVRYLKNNTLVIEGLWITKDTEGKIAKQSALGKLMEFYKVNKLSELANKKLKTSINQENYLVIKAYD